MKKILSIFLFLICFSTNAFADYYKVLTNRTSDGNSSAFKTSIPYNGALPTLHIFGTKGAATITLQGKDPVSGTWYTSSTDDINTLGFHTLTYNPEIQLRIVISGADGSTNISAIIYGATIE